MRSLTLISIYITYSHCSFYRIENRYLVPNGSLVDGKVIPKKHINRQGEKEKRFEKFSKRKDCRHRVLIAKYIFCAQYIKFKPNCATFHFPNMEKKSDKQS